MERIAMLNKIGLTLVEVLIALVVSLLVFLALMQTALVSIDSNMRNTLRDEAVRIAEQRITALRNISFDDPLLADTGGVCVNETPIPINFRSLSVNFTSCRNVDDLTADTKRLDVTITWEWKEKTVANGDPYRHSISTILRRQ